MGETADVVFAALFAIVLGVGLFFMDRTASNRSAEWNAYTQDCKSQGGEAVKGRDGWHCVAALRPTAPPQ